MINSNSPSPVWKANTDHEKANKKGEPAQLLSCPLGLCRPAVPHVKGSSENPLHSTLLNGRDARLLLRTPGLVGIHKLLVLGGKKKKIKTVSDASL